MTYKFDLDVEKMSRDQLVKNYFAAVYMAEELRNNPDERLLQIKDVFGLTTAEATILNLLLTGRIISNDKALAALGSSETVSSNLMSVYLCKIRKKISAFNLKIHNIFGEGYMMNLEQCKNAEQVLSGDKPFNHTAVADFKTEV